MAHSLDGCLIKLDRADSHFDALQKAIGDRDGWKTDLIPGEFDLDRGEYLFRAPREISVDPRWSAIIGDLVHNLSAALDYLVCELVIVNGGVPTAKTAFPIFTDPGSFQTGARAKRSGMSSDAAALIERVQPFYGGYSEQHPSEHPLAWLYELERRDKHRALNPIVHAVAGALVGLPEHIHHAPGGFRFIHGPSKRGTILGRMTTLPDEPRMSLFLSVTYAATFDLHGPAAGRDVLEVLDRLRHHIRATIVPEFAQFF